MAKWKLLEPIKVGNTYLKNRIVMPPMEARLNGPDGSITRRMIRYYAERAKGGTGLIIIQNTHIDGKASRSAASQGGIHHDHIIAGLNELAEAIQNYGTAAVIQIGHGGRQCAPGAAPMPPVAPSAVPFSGGAMPRELTLAEIEELQDAFVEAARRAKQSGFDGVEVHGAHGYLLCQFLSPDSNRRTDKYGGSFENRARFPLEIVRKVREQVGNDFIVGYRMSADEYVPGGLTLEETGKFAKMIEAEGIDYIHVSAGTYESLIHMVPPMYIERAHLVHLAEAIKKLVKVPIITVGALDVETAEAAIGEGKADMAALGRALIADPEIPNKLRADIPDDIRPCIRGNEGCLSRFNLGRTMRCEINPACGREEDFSITPAVNKKRVMVVGGGIAGMEAARIARLRGHEVTLFEKTGQLGGHLLEASVPKFKQKTKALIAWSNRQLEKERVSIELGKEVTPELVREIKPDVIILAVGSDYLIPKVKGYDNACVCTAGDVLLGNSNIGNRVLLIGGGLVGCETALYIADELGKKVTLVEMLDEILPETENVCKLALTEKLQESGVEIHTGFRMEEIGSGSIIGTTREGKKQQVETDTVVLATGLGAREKAVALFDSLAPEVYTVGDCAKARKIYNAFEDAWRVVLAI